MLDLKGLTEKQFIEKRKQSLTAAMINDMSLTELKERLYYDNLTDTESDKIKTDFKHMQKRITQHNIQAQETENGIQGYAIIIVGSERCSYISFTGQDDGLTYEESEARIFATKKEASQAMCSEKYRKFFKYSRIVLVKGQCKYNFAMLPTSAGH